MKEINYNNISSSPCRIIILILLLEYLMFIFSGVSFSFLSYNKFFNIGVDPLYWIFYVAGIPQIITSYHLVGILADVMIVVFLGLLANNCNRHAIAWICFSLLLLFYLTLTGYHGHRNYQSGFFLVLFPLLFKKDSNRHFAFSFIRYYLLFFYFSAGLLKIMSESFLHTNHFNTQLLTQFTPYFLEGNAGIRTSINLFLIKHTGFSYFLFLCSVAVELFTAIGFFTRKFDKWLGVILLFFHLFNWVIMDIAPIGQLAFISLLLFNVFPDKADNRV